MRGAEAWKNAAIAKGATHVYLFNTTTNEENDLSGNGYNLSPPAGDYSSALTAGGPFGNYIDMNGFADGWDRTEGADDLNPTVYSVEIIVEVPASASTQTLAANDFGSGSTRPWTMQLDGDGDLQAYGNNQAGPVIETTGTVLDDNDWHHLVFHHSWTDGHTNHWVDGSIVTTDASGSTSQQTNTLMGVGCRRAGIDVFQGGIAGFAYYSGVELSSEDVAFLYDATGMGGVHASKLTDLPELSLQPAEDDWFYIVDRSDTTDDAAGSSRKIEANRIGGAFSPCVSAKEPGGGAGAYSRPTLIRITTGSISGAVDSLYCSILPVTRNITITDFAVQVSVAQASSNVRLGIYNANQSNGQVTTLVSDLGTVSTAATGFIEKNGLSVPLSPGFYWSVWAVDTASISFSELRALPLFQYGWGSYNGVGPFNAFVNVWRNDDQVGNTPSTSGMPADLTGDTWTSNVSGNTPGLGYLPFYTWTVS